MPAAFYPTLHQHLATDYRRNLAVTAGAGTGKTEVLTRRILKIAAQEKHLLDRLLVLTFTDKAASEMKERIYNAVEKELSAYGDPHFQRMKDTFYNNYISTFHAFCAALLREYPIEAGIDPYFRVLDETDKVFFLRRCINRSLRALAADKNHPDIHRLSGEFTRTTLANAVFDIIQKREHLSPWLQSALSMKRNEYMQRLQEYSTCMQRELCYKLHMSKTMDICSRQLTRLTEEVPFDASVLSQRRDRLLQLLPQLTAALEPAAHRSVDAASVMDLKNEILKHARLSKPSAAWRDAEEAYDALKTVFLSLRYALNAFTIEDFMVTESHEAQGYELLKALARIAGLCLDAYNQEKAQENYMDFQDLQLKVLDLLQSDKHPHVLTELQERFLYIMVDEFQDTNDLQWQILRSIAAGDMENVLPKLFIVGDEKQAIYSFRGGDVRLFSRVRRELKAANHSSGHHLHPFDMNLGLKDYHEEYQQNIHAGEDPHSGEILFSENFRSASIPIQFFNMFFYDLLFREIYEEYDARPQRLLCAGNKTEGGVELLLVNKGENGQDEEATGEAEKESESDEAVTEYSHHFKEALLIVHKLQEVFLGEDEKYARVRDCARKGRPAAAILLNRRTMIKTYEEALRLHRIDFTVVRGRGFYQRQEIIDIGNLLRFLTNPADNLSLAAFLRSPAGHVSDEGILLLTGLPGPASLYDRMQTACDSEAGLHGFSDRDKDSVLYAAVCLKKWLALAGRLPLSEYLRCILLDGGYYASLSRGARGGQAVSNLEKLLDTARDKSLEEAMDLTDFSQWLNDRIDHIEEEGEADVDISLGGAVQIMTVHQSKGLEFPLVFVPDLGAVFNFGDRDLLHAGQVPVSMDIQDDGIARSEISEIGLNAPNPEMDWESEPILIKRILKKRLRDQLIAERKRLLYVAATRAMDHLILVGSANFSSQKLMERIRYAPLDSLTNWMEWLMMILNLPFALSGTRGALLYEKDFGSALSIPYHTYTDADHASGSLQEFRTDFPL